MEKVKDTDKSVGDASPTRSTEKKIKISIADSSHEMPLRKLHSQTEKHSNKRFVFGKTSSMTFDQMRLEKKPSTPIASSLKKRATFDRWSLPKFAISEKRKSEISSPGKYKIPLKESSDLSGNESPLNELNN